jgi:hypothetical protein
VRLSEVAKSVTVSKAPVRALVRTGRKAVAPTVAPKPVMQGVKRTPGLSALKPVSAKVPGVPRPSAPKPPGLPRTV